MPPDLAGFRRPSPSAKTCTELDLPQRPTPGAPLLVSTVLHGLRGQSYMRHRASFAGILHESRRLVDMAERRQP
ncbi:hypothetical protein E4J66_10290 [Actinomyces viscosus]|nr:hypothetical protein E4J66_10290 [Actinomyces viscosus]